jgi:hypothetical protein
MPEQQNPMAVLWERLAGAKPDSVAARAAVAYDAAKKAYRVPLCGSEQRVHPGQRSVAGPDGPAGYEATLVCVQYLLTARDEPASGEVVLATSLPYGEFFFRGPHPMPTDKVETALGESVALFRAAAEALDGRGVDMGDAGFEFAALPRLPITVVLWAADDEFPARAQFLFDRTAHLHLPLDALWVLSRILAKRLVSTARAAR